MKTTRLLLYLLIPSLIFLNWGCEYKLTDEFFRDIKVPDSAQLLITLNPAAEEYVIYEDALISFNLTTFGLKVYDTRIYFDSVLIYEFNDSAGAFLLVHSNSSSQPHLLTLVVTTNTNTGSLSDIVHAEGFVFMKSWNVWMLNAPMPDTCRITHFTDTLGKMTIHWERYSGVAFKNYEIIKMFSDHQYAIKYNLTRIEDVNQTEFVDSTYVGGWVKYALRLTTSGGTVLSDFTLHNEYPSALSVSKISGSRVKFSWNKCYYYKNFKEYRIFNATSTATFPGRLIFSTTNIDSTNFYYDSCVTQGTVNSIIILDIPNNISWYPMGCNWSGVSFTLPEMKSGLQGDIEDGRNLNAIKREE